MSRCRSSTGSLFHSRGPATAKLLSPSRVRCGFTTVLRIVTGVHRIHSKFNDFADVLVECSAWSVSLTTCIQIWDVVDTGRNDDGQSHYKKEMLLTMIRSLTARVTKLSKWKQKTELVGYECHKSDNRNTGRQKENIFIRFLYELINVIRCFLTTLRRRRWRHVHDRWLLSR